MSPFQSGGRRSRMHATRVAVGAAMAHVASEGGGEPPNDPPPSDPPDYDFSDVVPDFIVTTKAELESTYSTCPPGSGIMIANDISPVIEFTRAVRDTSAPNIRIWSNPANVDPVHGLGYIRFLSGSFDITEFKDNPIHPHNTEFYNIILEHGSGGGNNSGWGSDTRANTALGNEIENVSWFNCIMDAEDTGYNMETNTGSGAMKWGHRIYAVKNVLFQDCRYEGFASAPEGEHSWYMSESWGDIRWIRCKAKWNTKSSRQVVVRIADSGGKGTVAANHLVQDCYEEDTGTQQAATYSFRAPGPQTNIVLTGNTIRKGMNPNLKTPWNASLRQCVILDNGSNPNNSFGKAKSITFNGEDYEVGQYFKPGAEMVKIAACERAEIHNCRFYSHDDPNNPGLPGTDALYWGDNNHNASLNLIRGDKPETTIFDRNNNIRGRVTVWYYPNTGSTQWGSYEQMLVREYDSFQAAPHIMRVVTTEDPANPAPNGPNSAIPNMFAWTWAGTDRENITGTQIGSNNIVEITNILDLSGNGNHFTSGSFGTANPCTRLGVDMSFGQETGVSIPSPQFVTHWTIGMDNWTVNNKGSGANRFGCHFKCNGTLNATGEFYLFYVISNTRRSGDRMMHNDDNNDLNYTRLQQRADVGTSRMRIRIAGGTETSVSTSTLPAGLQFIEVMRDGSNNLFCYVNGVDKSAGNSLSGTMVINHFGNHVTGGGGSTWDDLLWAFGAAESAPTAAQRLAHLQFWQYHFKGLAQ